VVAEFDFKFGTISFKHSLPKLNFLKQSVAHNLGNFSRRSLHASLGMYMCNQQLPRILIIF